MGIGTGSGKGGKRPGAGRPKGSRNTATADQLASISDLAKQHTEAALSTLVEICSNRQETGSARVSAANAILDRGYGRPQQSVDMNLNRKPPEDMTDDELAAIAAGGGEGAT